MQPSTIKELLVQGEGVTVEFKRATDKIPDGVYQTVCAFLNRAGGYLLLGVEDNGKVIGVSPKAVVQLRKDLSNSLNNHQILNPPIFVIPNKVIIEGKTILSLYIPESSQVHRCKGKIFDRNEDGDYDITNNTSLVSNLYIRKQSTFTENTVFPYLAFENLNPELIRKARQMAVNRMPGHPWEKLSDQQLLKSVQLYRDDYQTGKSGYTLAAILLFGYDEVILSAIPFHRVDALVRIKNTDRYDDRDDIRTNLLDSYDRLIAFVEKHLPDKFVLEEDIRINVRNLIFREIISNMLIHKEYTNPYPSRLIIEKDFVISENSNKPRGVSVLKPDSYVPFPKNPAIARVFKEIGRADELGSGVLNLFKYYHHFSNQPPLLKEDDIFQSKVFLQGNFGDEEILNVEDGGISGGINEVAGGINDLLAIIGKMPGIKVFEISEKLNISINTIDKRLRKLKKESKVEYRGSKKLGGYFLTEGTGYGGINELDGGINGGINEHDGGINDVFERIISTPGIKTIQISETLKRPIDTVEKQLRTLKRKNLVEYRGSKKTGGYFPL